jgi:hypothetical protein
MLGFDMHDMHHPMNRMHHWLRSFGLIYVEDRGGRDR